MSASAPAVSQCLRLSSALKIEEDAMVNKKQGIVSILGSDTTDRPNNKAAASLRRTLSADMSSKKWLSQHGFSPMKKIASTAELRVSITEPDVEEDEYCEEEKNDKGNHHQLQKPAGVYDIWSSILSQKAQEGKSPLPPPYVHPLVKRSASCLSEKSLEICTESLGSETGSDGFSSYPPSEISSDVEEDQEVVQPQKQHTDSFDNYDEPCRVVKYNYPVGKKLTQRSFPPPLPSLSRNDGASTLRMKSHRGNGRFVLEAVSVTSHNNFHSQRQDGRLVLTFAEAPKNNEETALNETASELDELELEEEFASSGEEERESEIDEDEEENEETAEQDMGFVMEQRAPKLSNGAINVHRLALMKLINKPMGIANKNPTWPRKFNQIVNFEAEGDDDAKAEETAPAVAQSLPPRPPASRLIPSAPSAAAVAAGAASASFNPYEYFWRPKPMAAMNPVAQQHAPPIKNSCCNPKSPLTNEHQQMVVLRGNKGDYLVPLLKGCKDTRRSVYFREPCCIATS